MISFNKRGEYLISSEKKWLAAAPAAAALTHRRVYFLPPLFLSALCLGERGHNNHRHSPSQVRKNSYIEWKNKRESEWKKRKRRKKKSLLMTGCPLAVRLLHRPFKVIFRRIFLPWTPWSAAGGRNVPPCGYPSAGWCSQRKTCCDKIIKKSTHKGGGKREEKNQNTSQWRHLWVKVDDTSRLRHQLARFNGLKLLFILFTHKRAHGIRSNKSAILGIKWPIVICVKPIKNQRLNQKKKCADM